MDSFILGQNYAMKSKKSDQNLDIFNHNDKL